MVIVATGLLHEKNIRPEKSLRELSAKKFQRLFEVNTVVPAMIAKHFLPRLNTDTTSFFGFLSARAGSISDNQMGGWYAYRAAKAALNMIIKNAARIKTLIKLCDQISFYTESCHFLCFSARLCDFKSLNEQSTKAVHSLASQKNSSIRKHYNRFYSSSFQPDTIPKELLSDSDF